MQKEDNKLNLFFGFISVPDKIEQAVHVCLPLPHSAGPALPDAPLKLHHLLHIHPPEQSETESVILGGRVPALDLLQDRPEVSSEAALAAVS